jgi:hypothetical protein
LRHFFIYIGKEVRSKAQLIDLSISQSLSQFANFDAVSDK